MQYIDKTISIFANSTELYCGRKRNTELSESYLRYELEMN